ncbi:MAG: hypothetical protein JSV39_02410 [Candidatus Aenigmatarchaeota archaeon]|nr:MAG: hypothetical protein JSV39_02410 [Candidatus Aenigmarchaeota archaeon]
MRYMIMQGGSLVISIVLAISFFMLLFVGVLSPKDVIISLILIVIAIILLSILSVAGQIQEDLRRMKE